jgi:hypothetical protein
MSTGTDARPARDALEACPPCAGIGDQPAPAPVMWAMTVSNSPVGEKST